MLHLLLNPLYSGQVKFSLTAGYFLMIFYESHYDQWAKAYHWEYWLANGLTLTPLACQWSHW